MQTHETVSATEHILTLRNYPRKPAYLLAALEDVYARFGHIPEASIPLLRDYFGTSELPGTLLDDLFHSDLDGRPVVKICEGPLCVQAGSNRLAEAVAAAGNIRVERRFCMGTCHSAPAAEIQGQIVAPASLERVREQLLQN